MSTGCECEFIEVKPREWYYILEWSSAPKNAWDWREHADAYGPFSSFGEARRHLDDNHANPGGYSTTKYVEGYKSDEVEQKLIANATRRRW